MQKRAWLCPTDLSPSSDESVRLAVDLAASLGDVSLVLLHVDQLPTYGLPEGSVLDAASRQEWAARLQALAARHRRTVEIETQVRQGRAHSKILESADELAAEVIVMGTTGRSRLEATLLGSVAEKTMRLSSIPVLVVPTGSAMPVPRSHRALCPVDVSAEHSVEAARGAIRTAVQLGAEHVSLLHVFEVPLSLALMDHGTRRDEAIASLTARERARLASLQERCQELGARVEGAFVEGTVHDEISRRARTHGFEVIVMPTHGRGTVGQFLLGSVAAKVVRTSTVPVCTIRIQGLD